MSELTRQEIEVMLSVVYCGGWRDGSDGKDLPTIGELDQMVAGIYDRATENKDNGDKVSGWMPEDHLRDGEEMIQRSAPLFDVADRLTREKWYLCPPKDIADFAKDQGIVICFGCSDDLIELDGAIWDEAECFDGGTVYINKSGFVEEGSELKNPIKIFWCGECDGEKRDYKATWEYETDIPHETFRMYDEDEQLYCLGMVFYLEDVK